MQSSGYGRGAVPHTTAPRPAYPGAQNDDPENQLPTTNTGGEQRMSQ